MLVIAGCRPPNEKIRFSGNSRRISGNILAGPARFYKLGPDCPLVDLARGHLNAVEKLAVDPGR
ncbi:MAG: hypothetical protein A2521_09605 [Deltaproteobacteria bacterium RIFOXYD12_FULL_57_12]|nr:MAG: hypothetical protein A2521_09605 [Deltaproteobacteria bacterium RIFOXYD12_FULL_57_12]